VDGVTVVDWPLLTHNRLQVQLKHSDGRQLVSDQTCSGHGAKWHVSTLNARRFLRLTAACCSMFWQVCDAWTE
jgi:hypothetical protein